ncbi:MAG: hypothetical protein GX421_06750 [Caldisericales bacterium]|nr:hypothetical protein [Caldisericales bacterium]
MKYVKMVLVPVVMAIIVLAYYWLLAVLNGIWLSLATVVFIPAVFILFWYGFRDIKENLDGLISGILLLCITIIGTALFVFLFNWPWVVTLHPELDTQLATPIMPFLRLYAASFNWYCIGGFVAGSAIAGIGIAWLNRTK